MKWNEIKWNKINKNLNMGPFLCLCFWVFAMWTPEKLWKYDPQDFFEKNP